MNELWTEALKGIGMLMIAGLVIASACVVIDELVKKWKRRK